MLKRQFSWVLKNLSVPMFSLLLITSCQESPVKEVPIQPNDFVNGFTSGQISAQSPIKIVLNLPEEFATISEKKLDKDVFRLKPYVDGKTYWADEFTLLFEPDEPLRNGLKYEAQVNLRKLLGIEDPKNRLFRFFFDVIPLSFVAEIDNLKAYQKTNAQWNSLQIQLQASDIVSDKSLFEHLFTAEQQNKTLRINFTEETKERTYIFTIDSIERQPNESIIIIQWKGKEELIGFNNKGNFKFLVPSLNYFGLDRIKVIDEPDQHLRLEFSDPIDPSQNLDGLIYFTDNTPFRLSVENNSILIHPTVHLSGDRTIAIKKQVRTLKRNHLHDDIVQYVHFGQVKPAVKFTSTGTILPGSSSWIMPFEAINLKAVDVFVTRIYANNIRQFLQTNRLSGSSNLHKVGKLIHHEKITLKTEQETSSWKWKAYALDLSKMVKQEPGAIYRVELRFKQAYARYNCDDNTGQLDETDDQQNEERYYNGQHYFPSTYRWYDRDNPCSASYYNSNRFVQKNVIASNIGLTVKEDGKKIVVFANDLRNTSALSRVKISLYNYQNQEIATATTDENGVTSMSFEGEAYLLVAEKDDEFTYQKLDGGSSLSYSKFDTKGVDTKKGIKGFIYGERGVWRPGDTLFLTVIIDDRQNPLPKGHPVVLRLTDPRGKEKAKKTSVIGLNGFYTFKIPTDREATTGFWKARAEVGGAVFNKTIRIETIKPNRLKIELSFTDTILNPLKNKGTMNVRWLHGGIASKLKADINITIRPSKTVFKGFETYNFDDPSRIFTPEQLTIFDGRLNNKGVVDFDFELPSSQYAPGMLEVNIASKVYERGGDFSIDQTSVNFSPFDLFIGIRNSGEKPDSRHFDVDELHEFEIVTLSKTGEPLSVDNLEFEVYKLDWSWWYGSNSRNLASYISNDYARKKISGILSTKNGKGSFNLKINYPEWGWYFVLVKQANGGHQTGIKIHLDWPSWYSRENRKAPGSMSLLSLTTDKEKYNIDEEVKVSVPTPANGKLLITLEKGSKQIKSWQMKANGEETVITFETSPEMVPNVYLSVSVLQPHEQTVNDLPIRMYGIVPIMIENKKTVLKPILEVPETVRPNETYTINVSEENSKNMTYTIAVVDDGLLDLTHFKTPSPHKYFYAKEALAVKTWDIYDEVMGAFGTRLEKVFAIGGDMEMAAEPDNKKANRFKAVVTFLGPFQLNKGETKSHKLKMPNYIGSVRCMIIAGENGAYGKTQKTIAVKQPLMVLGTFPRILSPGESVKLPISVFVMDKKIRDVKINIETNNFFKTNKSIQKLNITEVGEHLTYFDIQVAEKQGIGKIKIIAESGKESASYEIEIQVRNPNPRVFELSYHILKAGEKWENSPELIGTEGSNEINLSVSGIPPLNLERRLDYLIRYPYGCIEQTTSSVFPQLYLDKLLDLQPYRQNQIEQNIKSGIKRLLGFQLPNGGFSYWPGNRSATDWGTSYAGHFLILAKERGYHVPQSVISSWVNYQKQKSNKWSFNNYNALDQAYRLYTLALAGKPNLGAMNRLRELEKLPVSARFRLAAAYALVGQKEVAQKLIRNIEYFPENNRNYWRYNYGSSTRDKSLIFETYLLLDETDKAVPFLKQITEDLKSERWLSTQSTAFALYAVSLIAEAGEQKKEQHFKYVWNKESSAEILNKAPIYSSDLKVKLANKLQIENLSENPLFVTLTNSGIPTIGEPLKEGKNLELEIKYFDMEGKPIDVTSLVQGTDFYAEATVYYPRMHSYYLDNIALSQVFASGWEIINTRMLDLGANLKSDPSDYIDYRDDRVNIFFNMRAGQKKRFIVLLNAAYQGKYYLPVTHCGAMYNNDINAVVGGGWVTVVK